jgi:hypothetical protein
LDDPTLPHGEAYRPLGRRAQIVTILLIIGIRTAIAGIVSGAMERSLFDDVQQGRFITPKQADDNDRRQLIVAVVDGTVFIATGVFFLFWFHRAYRNLPSLGGERRYGTGWAIGSWFVPQRKAPHRNAEGVFRPVGVELFVDSEKGGTDIRFDNVFVWPVPQ